MLDKTTTSLDEAFPVPEAASLPEGVDLRQAVRDYVAANSSSYKAISQVAGVGESTFTAWLGGKYRGDNQKIDEKVRTWLTSEQSFARHKAAMPADVAFVHTRTAKKILATFEHAQAMPDLVVVSGGAGVGKSSACAHYKATHPNVFVLTAEPSLSSSYAMMEYLREALSIPETASYRVSRAITLKLKNSQALIIIDEAQHLKPEAIDQLRSVHDRAEVGMALVGNEEVWKQIDGGGRNAKFAQIFSRVGMRVSVARSTQKDIEAMLDASDIADEEQRKVLKFVAGKPGALRGMVKTLRVARMLAMGAEEALSKAHLEAAYTRLSGGQEAQP
jgi:DNA transposition AAA+ family ATPase